MGNISVPRRAKRDIPEVRHNEEGMRLCSFCHRTLPIGAEDLDERMCIFHRRQWEEVRELRQLMKDAELDDMQDAPDLKADGEAAMLPISPRGAEEANKFEKASATAGDGINADFEAVELTLAAMTDMEEAL